MNRTKLIYFLSAFVLIIGCFALNQSYSMFTATAESDVISSTVPVLDATLSIPSITVEAGKEYLIKQTVTNNSVIPINFGISTDKQDNVKVATHDSIPNNLSYGIISDTDTSLASNSTKDIYLIVSNIEGTSNIVVNFTLNKNYTTITTTKDALSNITSEEVLSIGGLPYSDKPETLTYKIIENFANSNFYTGTLSNNIPSLFQNGITKLSLPLESTFEVPSPTTFTAIEENEVGLYQAPDDYGTSYYFRGASSINYVNFAGFTWRIVRINGDGSVRLILDGSIDKVTKEGETTPVYKNQYLSNIDSGGNPQFNPETVDNTYVGYMYGREYVSTSANPYDLTHTNDNDSNIKNYIDTFYSQYLLSYESYLADTIFCGDKSLSSSGIGGVTTQKGYGNHLGDESYYAATERLYYSTGTTFITEAKPTLECAKGATNTYSRYTSNLDTSSTTSKGVSVNNDLTYPIALLSADEIVLAGGFGGSGVMINQSYYLYDAFENSLSNDELWTMTPFGMIGSAYKNPKVFKFNKSSLYTASTGTAAGVRPVINLSADVIWNSGNGTSGSGAYTVKLAS